MMVTWTIEIGDSPISMHGPIVATQTMENILLSMLRPERLEHSSLSAQTESTTCIGCRHKAKSLRNSPMAVDSLAHDTE